MALPLLRVFQKHIEPYSLRVFQAITQKKKKENRREAKVTAVQITGVILTS